ncbi:nucleotidyltransferase family protein [Oceanithermus sp.]|uniref:nucleotidyltransferase family protein n=1 Tax=Oceanithermus sp. TaxID=2268145 RepID=UPI0025D4100C|nr:nucleotidyltransferase family protein [Oceanithermus sp.]
MTAREVLDELRTLMPELAARYHVRGLGLFGSFARGEAKGSSDIDLIVEFEEGADLLDLVGLSLYLEEKLGRVVDVVPKSAVREELSREIFGETLSV